MGAGVGRGADAAGEVERESGGIARHALQARMDQHGQIEARDEPPPIHREAQPEQLHRADDVPGGLERQPPLEQPEQPPMPLRRHRLPARKLRRRLHSVA